MATKDAVVKKDPAADAAKKAADPAAGAAKKGSTSTETGGSPTSSKTSTETTANPKHNVTVTGGAGDGDTIVTINLPKPLKEGSMAQKAFSKLLGAIKGRDWSEANEQFGGIMQQKVADRIQQERQVIGRSLVKEDLGQMPSDLPDARDEASIDNMAALAGWTDRSDAEAAYPAGGAVREDDEHPPDCNCRACVNGDKVDEAAPKGKKYVPSKPESQAKRLAFGGGASVSLPRKK